MFATFSKNSFVSLEAAFPEPIDSPYPIQVKNGFIDCSINSIIFFKSLEFLLIRLGFNSQETSSFRDKPKSSNKLVKTDIDIKWDLAQRCLAEIEFVNELMPVF